MMEEKVFRLPAVAGVLEERFVEARLHTDHARKGKENRARQQEMTGSIAQPIYLVIDPKTGAAHGRQDGATTGDQVPRFIEFLEAGWAAAGR